jgi:phytoene synthase
VAISPEAAEHCATLVRQHDPDRYFADLFAPADARPHLFALHAFNTEVSRIREVVSEPLPGEMRLQWWRDALRAGEAGGHPVAGALLDTIAKFNLPEPAFERLLEARTFDLYNDPMPDRATFEGYAGDTASVPFQLAAIILAGGGDPHTADAAGHGGVAWALAGQLRAFPISAARKQLFLPSDALVARCVDLDDVFERRSSPALLGALADLRALAREHLAKSAAATPAASAVAFLPLALVEPYLRRMETPGYDPFAAPVDLPQWRKQWILWRAARRAQKA